MKKWKLGKNLNSYIQSQTTRKLFFYGDKRRTRFIFLKSLFVATLTILFYLLCFFGIGSLSLDVFTFLMKKVGFSLGVLTCTSFLMKVGFPKRITSFIILIMRAIMTGESESSQIMMVHSGSSGPANPSGRPTFDLNLPASGEEEGDPGDIKRTLYQLQLAKVQEQKMKLAERIRPLIEEESKKQNLKQELPSETAMVENLIRRMAGTRARAANDPNAEMEEFKYLKTWLTRACQNAEDETKGQMAIRTEIKLIIQEYIQ